MIDDKGVDSGLRKSYEYKFLRRLVLEQYLTELPVQVVVLRTCSSDYDVRLSLPGSKQSVL
jgi:hypothetical protein